MWIILEDLVSFPFELVAPHILAVAHTHQSGPWWLGNVWKHVGCARPIGSTERGNNFQAFGLLGSVKPDMFPWIETLASTDMVAQCLVKGWDYANANSMAKNPATDIMVSGSKDLTSLPSRGPDLIPLNKLDWLHKTNIENFHESSRRFKFQLRLQGVYTPCSSSLTDLAP